MKITYCTSCKPARVVAMGPVGKGQTHQDEGDQAHGDLKMLEVQTQIFMPRTETLQAFMDRQTRIHAAKLV